MSGPAFATTVWPAQPVPQSTKDVLSEFFRCVDAPNDPQSNITLADQVFAADATFQINKRILQGRDEIADWRSAAASGDGITISKHEVQSVHVLDGRFEQLLTTGTLYLETASGAHAISNFACKCTIGHDSAGSLKITAWRGWIDYVPYAQAGIFGPARVYGEGHQRPSE